MIRTTLCLAAALALGACTEEDERPGRGSGQASPAQDAAPASDADTGPEPAEDAAARVDSAPPPAGGVSYLRIVDTSEGLGFGAGPGADIDAIRWTCGAEMPVWASAAFGAVIDNRVAPGSASPIGNLYGEAQRGCELVTDCAANLGLRGEIYVPTDRADLTGCSVEIFEADDPGSDGFEVFWCSAPNPPACGEVIGRGTDGAIATFTVPPRR
ncbi:MAG: hypothetical protein H6704_02410 [Myxococcales bacterium]|nr:hypothetical protein [Myxococcales bacterium]